MDLQKLRRELTTALERHGVKADAVLKGLGSLKDAEQKVASMERMAMELQKKVITLQQERDHLEEKLMRGAPISVTAEVERRQNLELKEITRLSRAEEESRSESSRLSQQLEDSENLCLSLRELLESAGQTDVCNSALLSGSGQNRTDLQKAGEEDQGRLQREDRCTQTEKVEEAGEGQTRPPSGSQSEARWTQTESMNGETYLPNRSESEAKWTQTESTNGEMHLPNRSESEAKWTQTEGTNGETHLPNRSESEAKWTQTEGTNGETHLSNRSESEAKWTQTEGTNGETYLPNRSESEAKWTQTESRNGETYLPNRSESEAKWTQTESRNGETYLPNRSESEAKWTQTESRNREKKARSRSGEKERAELQSLARKVEALQQQLKKLEAENQQLAEKASGRNTDSSSDEDDPLHPALKHKPQQKVKTLERQLKVLHSENLRLADKLGGYAPSSNRHDPDEIIERIVELEDFCTDLQDRVREAEGHERQMREKLRLAEQTINELESSEAQYRDKCDELWKQERETRKQLHSLQATGRELREIILDKDIVEQALTEKVEFLEKVEAQSSQRIQELESLERSYREQLESRDSAHSPGADSRSLQDKLAAAEREIEKLVARNNELEENEEILRENWRRVADEDANRLQCLEDKVRMLTLANQDLKHKVAEAQDFVVINSGPAQGSLADELSASSKRGQARPPGDGPMSGGSDDDSGDESPRKRVTKLKRQLSILEEEKNGKIANLQERVAELRENEIKLSETLAEMEMTERELRAKLALYESSEVTVEKMLKYQDKIHELKTSQESLLDQLETMETQEETLQEKLEDTERRLKGKIVTLEVELKNLKQKENKGNARIRELEKHEEELTEKTKIQAEKENGLYVRISGLMDQVKERTARVSELEKKLAEKEERCRKVASLETKFLQIEGAYRDKVTALESSLAEAQSTLEEQQKQHEETRASLEERLASLEESLESRDKEHNQRVFILEEMFAQKEQGLNEKISSLESSVAERDRTISRYDRELGEKDDRICELERDLSERDSKVGELETLVSSKESEESELEKALKAKDDRISELESDVSRRDAQISKLERGLSERDSHVTELDKDLCDKHARLGDLKKELSEKQACISELERDVREKVSRIGELKMELGTKESRISEAEKDLCDFNRLQGDLSEKNARINELEENLSSRISHISELEQDLASKSSRIEELEQDLGRKISHISELEQDLSSKVSRISQLEEDLGEKNSQISQLEKDLGDRGSEVRQLEKDLSKKDESVCEMERAVVEKDSCISRLERELDDKVSIISRLEKDLGDKVSCISRLEKDLGDKVSCISRLEKDLGDKVSCISRLEKDLGDKVSRVRQLEAELEDRERQIGDLETRLEALESETSDRLEQAQRDNTNKDNHIAQMEERVIDMSSTISQLQQEAADKDLRVSALEKRLADNDTVAAEHVSQLQMELETKQKSSTDTVSSLEKELAAAKSQLSQTEAKSSESCRQLAALQAELEEERACVRAVKERQEALEAERDRVQSELSARVSELEGRLKEEGLHFQTQMSVRESQFQQACASLDAECESLRGEVMEKNMVIEKLESNKNELLSKIESLKDRERDLANRISVLEADFGSLHAQKDEELKHVVSSLENRLENTQREKETAEEKLYSLEAELQSSNETIAQQLQEMSRLESDTRQAKSQMETLQEQLSELRSAEMKNSAQADALLQQEVTLKSRMSQVEMQLEASSKNTKDQEASMSALLRQKQDLEAALVKVEADLSDSHKLNAQLQETVHELTSRTKSLQQEVADLTKELASHQAREQEIHELLAREKGRLQDLEAQISSLKEEKESAVAEAERLGRELAQSRETVARLENQIVGMDKDEASLKLQIAAEQSAKQDLDNRLSEMSEEVRVSKERVAQLQKAAGEREEEVERLKADLVSRSHQLESQQRATSGVEQKDKELEELRRREKALKGRETTLQDKIASLEGQMGRYQEDHSQMCHKLQELEKREKELLEQITDIEQTVIVPLEAENSELKEEIQSLKQQNESLNVQMDKQEEQAREDSEELDALRKSVSDLQISRTEIQSKLDIVSRELTEKESENETLHAKLLDVETVNKNLQDELDNNRVEIDKIALEFNKELCSRDTQTDWDVPAWEAERQVLQSKVTVLQDAEDKFMSRIVELEEREQQLSEELLSARRLVQEKDLCARQTQTDDFLSQTQPSPPDTADASANTDGLQEPSTAKVPELFARVQELEVANHQLMSSLEQATAGEVDRRQLTEKLQLLEQAEDRLMERVMELEENEVALRTQIDRTRYRAKVADELEEEVSVLLQQEDEWKDKEAALTAQSSALSRQLEQLQSQLAVEQSRNDGLSRQVETEQRQLHDAQKELRLVQTKLQAVRSEYEEKLSALEESEKKMENQLHSRSQEESDLRQEMQVLREEIEDVCERYKELEQENSTLKQQHAKAQLDLKDAEARCLQTTGQVSREPTLLTAQAQTQLSTLPPGARASLSPGDDPDQQLSPPRMCSTLSLQMVQSSDSQDGAQTSAREESLLARIAELEKELSRAGRPGSGGGLRFVQDSVDSVGSEPTWDEQGDSDSSGFHSAPASQQSVKILTLSSALEENAALKAQLRDLQSRSATPSQHLQPQSSADGEKLSSAAVAELQGEVSALQRRVAELEQSLAAAEGAVQEVVTVIRTRSVHTLEQKIETIQQTIHTQSPAWPLHQELLELLTTQADLQKQVSHLMETEHNLRTALKQAEDELSRVKSGAGATTLSARRAETERRLGIHSRLSRFGGGTASSRAPGDTDQTCQDSGNREKQQWLERQVADLQLAKSSLERRLHEAERRLAFRPRPTSASREELLFRIDQLQREQGEWRKKVEDLEALNSHYLKEKLELAQDRNALEQKLQELGPGVGKEVNVVFVGGTREEPLGSSGSVSEGEPCADPATTAANMLEKPEDVLQKRIKELENVENYLRQQLSEMEADRDQLHEIARKDKAMIHEQNVRLRELMLQERNLRSQVSGLEDSERSLYNRCSELEDNVTRLEDRVHELEVHERRLRELVRKLKLDEEVWLSKSGDLTSSMEQLSSSEVSLRKLVQDLQIEKGGLSDRTEYLEARVKELESLEATLVQRLKNYENMEASMQSRLHHLENSEAAAYSKASELDVINMDLSSRLQRAVEENAVLSQHVAQQQGQIHELDRKLSAATDAEVGLNQHVESLQKSETSLQKKVREYELRDIDAQARIRELEQMEEILKDKVNQLQRSENRLKSRLVEFETVGSQMLEDLPPTQRQQLPQKLEDCQKRVVVLQRQLEAAQAELHRPQLAEDDATSVKVPTAALAEMRTKVALLEETEYQMSELEKLNAQLNQNILLLQQGKGSCGHEVELEVLKRRLHSYQNLIQKLKHYLSEGQVPSLWATDTVGQGPESEDLPARDVQRLESERALHGVRSLTKPPGLPPAQEERLQASSSGALHAGRAQGVASVPSEPEESHWRTVELRRDLAQGAELRGASASMPHASATAPPRQEELMIGLSLASESERGSFKSQNDTDSEMSGAPHPHLRVVGSTPRVSDPLTSDVVPSSGVGGRTDSHHPPMPTTTTTTTTTTWAPATPPLAQQQHTNAAFAQEDSFYLPSSVPSESESMEEDEAPPLPASAPPGMSASAMQQRRSQPASAVTTPVARKSFVSAVTMPSVGQGSVGVEGPGAGEAGTQKRLQTTSVVGLSIRQRIAQIEKQLKEKPSPKAGSKEENEDVFTWKAKAVESARLLTVAERESKQLKEDINKLEKDLEEKRRYMDIFEKWILDAEEVLKNKNKKNDRDLVQQLQTEVKHLKQDLGNAGYRKDDIFTDPAALKTELDRRERELSTKQSELDSMAEEVQRWRQECNNVEMMRSNALDALRLLETEVTQLQDADIQLKQMKDEYNRLRGQFEDVWKRYQDLNQALSDKDDLEFTLKRTILERDHLKCDLAKVTEERDELEPKLHELRARVRDLSHVEAENASLESQVASVNRSLKERTEKLREVYEENLNLHERLAQLQLRLEGLRETRRDLDNMCARYDEVNVQKNKAVAAVHVLRAKVARLAKKCQEKDEILRQLSEDLRGGRGRSSSLLEELSRLEVMAGGEEYNRPLSPLDLITGPLMSDTERLLSERIPDSTFTRWPSSSSLGDPRDFASSAELLRSGDRSSLRRPKSAEQIRTGQQGVQPPGQFSGIGSALGYGGESLCVAILDYQPDTASRSGHRHLELPLKEGDQVRIRGPVDRFGYCEAEVGGRTGLVPASHLYPLTDNAATYRPASQPHGRHKKSGGDSAEQIVQMFDELQDSRLVSGVTHNHSSQPSQHAAHSTATQTRQRRSVTKSHLAPEAPTNLRIEEVEGNSLVLAWQPPHLDQHGCSNGSKVVGYRIYLNGRVCQQPHSPRLSRTCVEGVRHDRPQQLAIQTLAASGQVSSRLELIYQGVKSPPARGDSGEDGEADTDLSSILNSIHYKTGRKRIMMGLYDYDPEKQSPGDYTACELAFHAGDILLVYGEERPDGFFHGERNGQRGLVPACFVEPVTQGGKSAQKHSAANGPSCP